MLILAAQHSAPETHAQTHIVHQGLFQARFRVSQKIHVRLVRRVSIADSLIKRRPPAFG